MTGKMFVDAVNVLRKVSAAVDMTEKQQEQFLLAFGSHPTFKTPSHQDDAKNGEKRKSNFFCNLEPKVFSNFYRFFFPQ